MKPSHHGCRAPWHYSLYPLFITTVVNVFFIVFLIHAAEKLLPVEPTYSYLEDDFPSQLPLKLPTVGMVLENGYPYFSLHAEREWASQFYPPTEGFVDLGPNNRTFVVSMIHQMHCLEAFRVGFIKNGTAAAHHVEHCLRYMRQTVLCNADLTLEPAHPVVREGKWTHGASGVGSVHRCRDWTALRRYVEAHPAHEVLGPEVDNTPSSR